MGPGIRRVGAWDRLSGYVRRMTDVARMRLISQGLIEPMGSAAEVVRAFGCTQGQDFPGSTLSVALRTTDRTVGGVRAAYDAGQIVRTWSMRGTLFVVAAEDLGWMLSLTAERTLAQTARRREALELGDADLYRAEEIAREVLTGPGLTRRELLEVWTERGHAVEDGRGYHSLVHLAVRGVLCQGPMSGAEQRWVLTDEWITSPRALVGEEAMAEWVRRYVTTHGPVPIAEFSWWTKLPKRPLAPVLAALRPEFEVVEVDGVEHWMASDLPDRWATLRRRTTAPLLLPGFDEVVLGYGDRSAVLTKQEEALVVPGGNGVFKPTLIHHGRAIGTWARPRRRGEPVTATAFADPLPAPVTRALPVLTAALPD